MLDLSTSGEQLVGGAWDRLWHVSNFQPWLPPKTVLFCLIDDMHDMSLQGPVAVDFLAKHVPGIRDLAYFGILQTKLFGRAVMISRTGYTGERGYENILWA